MDIKREDIKPLNALIKISMGKEDYESKVNKKLKEYTQKVEVKGFRKGKVPLPMIKNMYGSQVLLDEINTLVSESLQKYIKDQEINILAEPILQENGFDNFDIKNPGPLDITFEVGIAPELKINVASKKAVRYNIKIDKALLDKNIEGMQLKYGNLVPSDVLSEEGFIQAELQELSSEGEIAKEGIKNISVFPLNILKEKVIQKKIMALKKEDSFVVNMLHDFDRDNAFIAKELLNISLEKLEKANPEFNLKMLNYYKLEKAEMNKVFFDAILGKDAAKNETEFMEKYEDDLVKYYEKVTGDVLYYDIVEKIIDDTKVSLPDEFLKKWLNKNNKQESTTDQPNGQYEQYAKSLKQRLVIDQLLKDQNIKIQERDIEKYAEDYINKYLLASGQFPQGNEQIMSEYKKRFLEDKKFVNEAVENLIKEKLMSYFEQNITIKEKEISLDKFNKQIKKRR